MHHLFPNKSANKLVNGNFISRDVHITMQRVIWLD